MYPLYYVSLRVPLCMFLVSMIALNEFIFLKNIFSLSCVSLFICMILDADYCIVYRL
jgi:hypothetical protein